MVDQVELLACRVCGGACDVQVFPAGPALAAPTKLYVCENNKQLGGKCQLEWAFLTPEAWNRGSICGIRPNPNNTGEV